MSYPWPASALNGDGLALVPTGTEDRTGKRVRRTEPDADTGPEGPSDPTSELTIERSLL